MGTNYETLFNPLKDPCFTCGLYRNKKSPCIRPPQDTPPGCIVLVGEGPGEEEDRQGQAFCGRSGQLLRGVLTDLGVLDRCVFLNAVRCRPTTAAGRNRTPTVKEIELCRPFTDDDLRRLTPQIIICLGASAARSFGLTGGLNVLRRRSFTYRPGVVSELQSAVPPVLAEQTTPPVRSPLESERAAANPEPRGELSSGLGRCHSEDTPQELRSANDLHGRRRTYNPTLSRRGDGRLEQRAVQLLKGNELCQAVESVEGDGEQGHCRLPMSDAERHGGDPELVLGHPQNRPLGGLEGPLKARSEEDPCPHGCPLYVTFHPAAGLRPGKVNLIRELHSDLATYLGVRTAGVGPGMPLQQAVGGLEATNRGGSAIVIDIETTGLLKGGRTLPFSGDEILHIGAEECVLDDE